ncbi:TonB-dependent receptor [Niveispirillum sp. KHB5.9]|uniref:TonB-dependent receptor n=1 Tax=Niveispirillum sp. KHB5.9 TaxID=3400269 RepID=UPI003A896330
MYRSKFLALTTSALVGAFAASAIVPAALAAEGELMLEEIIVTARKRKEDVQTVPIAIQALTADDLAERNISSLTDLGNNTPGITVSNMAGGAFNNVYVRGLAPANSSTDLNVEANVGIFIDGIYQTSRNTADILGVVDIAQLDVVKGPQSALYGRSTFAGAVGIVTARPGNDSKGTASVTVGNNKDYRGKVSLSKPIIEDKLAAHIAAAYSTYGGEFDNVSDPIDKLGGYEKRGVSGSLLFTPTENFTATLTGFASKSTMEMPGLSANPLSSHNCGGFNAQTQAYFLYCGKLPTDRPVDATAGIPDSTARARQAALELEYEFDAFSIVSVTGVTSSKNSAWGDSDLYGNGAAYGVCTVGSTCGATTGTYTRTINGNSVLVSGDHVVTKSQELRIQSPDDQRFQWLAGALFFKSNVEARAEAGTSALGLAPNERLVQILPGMAAGTGPLATLSNLSLVPDSNASVKLSSLNYRQNVTKSVFGSLGYEIIDDLRVSAEGRYNIDRKTDHCIITFFGAYGPCPGAQPLSAEFKSFTPRFTADYKVTEDVFLFASAAKGVRSGGFNAVGGLAANELTFEEEENWTYEAGVKSWLFDRRLMLNASVYKVDWTNLQISTFSSNPVVTQAIITNVGGMKTNGFEVQTEFKATDIVSVGGSVTYSDPKYGNGAYDPAYSLQCGNPSTVCELVTVPGRGSQASIEGHRPARSVKLQYNLHATADVPVSADWTLSGRVDVNYVGPTYTNSLNVTSFGERTLTNLRLSLDSEDYSIAAWVTNLTDENYNANVLQQPRNYSIGTQRIMEIYHGEGRRLGVTATARF